MSLTSSIAIGLFAALILSASLYGLTVSGHFPSEHRGADLRGGLGSAILWGSMLVVTLCIVWAVAFAARELPWYAAIIAGGGAVLATPLLLRPFPDAFVNSRFGLIVFAAASAALAILTWQMSS
jgi:hypothetical protein